MDVFQKHFTQDLTEPVVVRHPGGIMFTGDALSDTVSVEVFKDGQPATLGGTVVCKCIRADGGTVAFAGTLSGNVVSATLPAAAFAITGPLAVVLQVVDGGTKMSVLKAVYTVDAGETGTAIDPGTVIQDVSNLIAAIEAAIGSIPPEYSALLASIAPTFSASTAYPAGAYVWYDGTLYRFATNHAAGTWIGTDATAAVVSDDLEINWQYNALSSRNLLDDYPLTPGTSEGVTCTANGDGSYTLTGTNSGANGSMFFFVYDGTIPSELKSGRKYRCEIDSSTVQLRFAWYSSISPNVAVGNDGGTGAFITTVRAAANYVAIYLLVPGDTTINETVHPRVYVPIGTKELSGEVEELKSAFVNDTEQITGNKPLVFQKGQYRVYNDNTVSDLTTPVTDTATAQKMVCAKCPCIPGDVFSVKARGKGTSAGAIGFFDAAFKGIYRAGINSLYDNTIEAPANAAWFAVNHDIVEYPDVEYYAYKGDALVNRVAAVEGMLPGAPFVYLGALKSTDDLNTFNVKGWYMWTTNNSPINAPYSGSAGKLLVFSNGLTSIVQVFLSIHTDGRIRCRVGNSNGFSIWYTIANTFDVDELGQTVSAFRADVSGNGVMALIEAYKDENDTYTETFSFDLDLPANPRVLSIVAQYTGDAPTIRIVTKNPASGVANLTSPIYELGGTVEMTRRSWRIPAAHSAISKATVTITIPTGTVVSIREATLHDDQRNRYGHPGILFHGHRGSIAPSDTIEAFQIGAELGYNTMITIPKFTADDVGVCFHDDNTISGDLQWMDGSAITGADDKAISEYTYAEITQNFKIKSSLWGELHVPTIDDYFRVCSLTGMKPIFSIHSTPSGMFTGTTGTAHFETIKALAKKWNVLDGIGIKSGSDDVMGCARGVFGTTARYIWISGQTHAPFGIFNLSKSAGFVDSDATDLTGCEYDLTSEYFYPQTVQGATYYTETMASMADLLSKGYKLSIADASPYMTGAAMKSLIALGVTGFTVDRHISMGLDW